MPDNHTLKGLMKFQTREEWRERFDEVLDRHCGAALATEGMDFEDIAGTLGNNCATALWGCAFEDFITWDFEDEGGNIVDDYLKRRGWKESAGTKNYMKALRTSIMSLYEVSEIVPGKSFVARDLIRGGDPIMVYEGTATKALKQWDRLAARIIPLMGKHVLTGGILLFTQQASDMLFDGLRQVFGKKNAKKLPAISDEELRSVAFMFSISWLLDTIECALSEPEIQNTDGDELIFHDVRFPLASGVDRKDIAARVSNIPGMSQENEVFWNWLEEKPHPGTRKPTGLSFESMMDSGASVLGNIELKGKFLHLLTNSLKRAQKGTALIRQALGDLVHPPLTEIRTIEQMIAEQPPGEQADQASEIPPEMAEQLIHQHLDQHYRETLDQPIAMLGDKTPRQAAKSAAGRQKVAEWLKYLENGSARQTGPQAGPMATYSFEWMWHELGVTGLRQG